MHLSSALAKNWSGHGLTGRNASTGPGTDYYSETTIFLRYKPIDLSMQVFWSSHWH